MPDDRPSPPGAWPHHTDLSNIEMIEERDKIAALTQVEACRLLRFAPAGHLYFQLGSPLQAYFLIRYKALGGMTPAISKEIDW